MAFGNPYLGPKKGLGFQLWASASTSAEGHNRKAMKSPPCPSKRRGDKHGAPRVFSARLNALEMNPRFEAKPEGDSYQAPGVSLPARGMFTFH